jgi:hypothetical protein
MLRTPPVHRQGSLPRVRRLVNAFVVPQLVSVRAYCSAGACLSMEPGKMKGRSLGTTGLSLAVRVGVWSKPWVCVGRRFNERLGNRCGLGMRRLRSMRDGLGDMQCRISTPDRRRQFLNSF